MAARIFLDHLINHHFLNWGQFNATGQSCGVTVGMDGGRFELLKKDVGLGGFTYHYIVKMKLFVDLYVCAHFDLLVQGGLL